MEKTTPKHLTCITHVTILFSLPQKPQKQLSQMSTSSGACKKKSTYQTTRLIFDVVVVVIAHLLQISLSILFYSYRILSEAKRQPTKTYYVGHILPTINIRYLADSVYSLAS